MPPAKGSCQNCVGKFSECAQLALKDQEFEDVSLTYTGAAIYDDHKYSIHPKSFKAASKSPLTEKWDTVMKEQLDAIGQHRVLGDFVQLPEGRKALPSHWVYKILRDGAGNVQRFDARQVSGGNHQIEGINFQAMYAPTARLGHIRLALAIAAKDNLQIHQMAICTAFLGVDWEDETSMHPAQGYCLLLRTGSRYNNPSLTKTSRKMVLHFRQSLYGLMQPTEFWYGTFNDLVISIGFVASRVDRGLFVLYDEEDHGTVVAAVILYVDDLLIIANDGFIELITDQMKKRFRMHDLRSVSFYLGVNIEHNQ